MFGFDPLWMALMLVTLIIAGGAQLLVKGAYAKWSRVRAAAGITGAEAARRMLIEAGVGPGVRIERVGGFLSDHYDPRHKVLRLSPDVHDGRSVASLGIACHEAGHAIQDATKYAPLVLRNAIVPLANIGSTFSWIVISIGAMLYMGGSLFGFKIAMLGVLLFGCVVIFQIVNLPVEFDASARAKAALAQTGLLRGREEIGGVNSVLNAAAMTYVAATVSSILQLLYWLHRLGLLGGRRE